MSPKMIAALLEAAIPFCGGLYATLLGYRIVGKKPGEDPTYDQKIELLIPLFKWGGPSLMLFGVFVALKDILPG